MAVVNRHKNPRLTAVTSVSENQAKHTQHALDAPFAPLFMQEDASRYADLLGPTPLTTGPAGTPPELADAEKVSFPSGIVVERHVASVDKT